MNDDAELACILAPIAGGSLLLPNVAVAEVMRGQRVRTTDGLPPWCMGRIMWRGVILPLISFEGIRSGDGAGPPMTSADGILVINRTRDIPEFGFYGMLTRGTPRLLRLAAEDLDAVADAESDALGSAAELGRVYLGEDVAIIPRLAFLEDQILEHRLYGPAARP
ncbi:MAG: chemotaxis protein CheW [Gammaproteobacteria bacterium]|nr:chemotaxis protein CheW [Gammaproteobacteria bacterium]